MNNFRRSRPSWSSRHLVLGVTALLVTVTLAWTSFTLVHRRSKSPEVGSRWLDDSSDILTEYDAVKKALSDISIQDDPDTKSTSADTSFSGAVCRPSANVEYSGSVVVWGAGNQKETAEACCEACVMNAECTVWVWCGRIEGCSSSSQNKECWLKKASNLGVLHESKPHPAVLWTSGTIIDDATLKDTQAKEDLRLKLLREDPSLPLVYLDIAIKGKLIGRIVIVLFKKDSPLATENFRAFCTGEKGKVPVGQLGAGLKYHYKGAVFYRIVDRFINQAGLGTDSVYGGMFKDDPGGLQLKHDRKGLISMANSGPDTNTNHFSILMAPASHLDGHYTVFGEVVAGLEFADAINCLAKGQPDSSAGVEAGASVLDSGQLR